jgi:redox-sensing transcriptional repressor
MSQSRRNEPVPEATIPRLSSYLRQLQEMEQQGQRTVSSRQLADAVGSNPAQVRKDLSYFGEFGTRGVGYDVHTLAEELRRQLGLDRSWNIIIIGAGKLGTALALYRGFEEQGFNLVGMFDSSPDVIGSDRGAGPVLPITGLEDFIAQKDVHIAMITTPADSAQEMIDRVVAAGVPSVLNFAPIHATAGKPVILRQVDLSTELMTLSFYLEKP